MDVLPHAWLAQCAPGGRVLCPVYLGRTAPTIIGLVRLTVGQDATPQSPTVAVVKSGGGIKAKVEWQIWPAALTLVGQGYEVFVQVQDGEDGPHSVVCSATSRTGPHQPTAQRRLTSPVT